MSGTSSALAAEAEAEARAARRAEREADDLRRQRDEAHTALCAERKRREAERREHARQLAAARAEAARLQRQCEELSARMLAAAEREQRERLQMVADAQRERSEVREAAERELAAAREAAAARQAEEHQRLLEILQDAFLGRRRQGDNDVYMVAQGLYLLWKKYYTRGHISREELLAMMREQTQVDMLCLCIQGRAQQWSPPDFPVPLADVEPFVADVVAHLPCLDTFGICNLPSAALYCDAARPGPTLPATVTFLLLNLTPFTVEQLRQIRERQVGLRTLVIDAVECTDWGALAAVADTEERMRQLKDLLNLDAIFWE